jgi:hypothetical protein
VKREFLGCKGVMFEPGIMLLVLQVGVSPQSCQGPRAQLEVKRHTLHAMFVLVLHVGEHFVLSVTE